MPGNLDFVLFFWQQQCSSTRFIAFGATMQRHLRAHCQEINVNAQEHTGVATAMGSMATCWLWWHKVGAQQGGNIVGKL